LAVAEEAGPDGVGPDELDGADDAGDVVLVLAALDGDKIYA